MEGALLFSNAWRVFTDRIALGDLLVHQGKIFSLAPAEQLLRQLKPRVVDCSGCYLAPGFVDIHAHGASGADVMDATTEALSTLSGTYSRYGTTSFLATTLTAPWESIVSAIDSAVKHMKLAPSGARLSGIHLEGPYIASEYRGAHPSAHCLPYSLERLRELIHLGRGSIRIVSLAIEKIEPMAPTFKFLQRHGVVVSVGHSAATARQVEEAAEGGLRHCAHMYNAMGKFHHREPGVIGAVLADDRITAEIIADGVHVHPTAIKVLLKAKGIDNVVLVTDAMRGLAMPDGTYDLSGQLVNVGDGEARMGDGTLAGSVLSMDRAVRNMIQMTGCSLVEAVRMAALNPARVIGLAHQVGSLAEGKLADLILLDARLHVRKTFVGGRVVHDSDDATTGDSTRELRGHECLGGRFIG